MDRKLSRRRAIAALGVTPATLAGCLDVLSDGSGSETESGTDSIGNEDGEGPTDAGRSWPAIDTGDPISSFESPDEWEAVVGELEPVTDEVPTGTQAVAVESDEDRAAIRIEFPRGLDLEGWDTSMAIKAESADRIHAEFMAPERGDHLTSIRDVPDDHRGWLRLDFGYIQKHGEPDLSDVRRLNVIAVGPEDGPTRIVADDLRRTEAVDNGKAIIALYGGFDSHYDLAAPLLEERGWAASVAVDPERIGGNGRLNGDQLRQLRDRGWDVCSSPNVDHPLPEMPDDRKRQVVEAARNDLEDLGFADGSRHLFVPDDRMDERTHAVVRDLHESAFLFGASPTGAPPTGVHASPLIWGPDLHGGVRRAINLCDQYHQLTALRIPRIVEDEADADANSMSLADFEHLLDHLEQRGLDVVTPSDVVDETMDGDGGDDESIERIEGTVLEGGGRHTFDGAGPTESSSFDLVEGVVTIDVSHDGNSVPVVELVPVDGAATGDRVSAVSASPGSSESIVTVDEGTYRLDVDADGSWSVELDQPAIHADDLEALPVDASGTGSSFVGPLRTDGDVSLAVTHDGSEQFVVDGYGADGSREQLINQTGSFDSTRSYSASGVAWVNVEADGNWTIEVSG
ncbi:polysaccharide deacetylase family protein [Natrialbaceae archaeon A-arb3/5]